MFLKQKYLENTNTSQLQLIWFCCFQYWHDTLNYEKYVTESRFIAEINNEGQLKNATYANNLTKLKKFVMVKNLNVSCDYLLAHLTNTCRVVCGYTYKVIFNVGGVLIQDTILKILFWPQKTVISPYYWLVRYMTNIYAYACLKLT